MKKLLFILTGASVAMTAYQLNLEREIVAETITRMAEAPGQAQSFLAYVPVDFFDFYVWFELFRFVGAGLSIGIFLWKFRELPTLVKWNLPFLLWFCTISNPALSALPHGLLFKLLGFGLLFIFGKKALLRETRVTKAAVLTFLLLLPASEVRARSFTAGQGIWKSIGMALSVARAGDTVLVDGVFDEHVEFPHSGSADSGFITLRAAPGKEAVIEGSKHEDLISIRGKSFVRVEGLELRNHVTKEGGAGIRVEGPGTSIEILNNHLHHLTGKSAMAIAVFGPDSAGLRRVTIRGNRVSDCEPAPSEAIVINGRVRDFLVEGNSIKRVNNIGIDIIGGEEWMGKGVPDRGIVRNNTVLSARSKDEGGFAAGIYVDGAQHILLENNTVQDSDLGLEVGAENPGAIARHIEVRYNRITNNHKGGLVFGGFSEERGRVDSCNFHHNLLSNNSVSAQGFGEVGIQWANRVQVHHNLIVPDSASYYITLWGKDTEAKVSLDSNIFVSAPQAGFSWRDSSVFSLEEFQKLSGQSFHAIEALTLSSSSRGMKIFDGIPETGFALRPKVKNVENGVVILLHGMARTGRSMKSMASFLRDKGLQVRIFDYSSTQKTVEEISEKFLWPVVKTFADSGVTPVSFVTHSLGGIVVRDFLRKHPKYANGRVVMLAPPNHGSELADWMEDFFLYKWVNGPAGKQLKTDSQSLPNRLGPANFEAGIVAGSSSFNPIFSAKIPGPDDGKVSVKSTRLDGMQDFLLVERSHTFIMNAPEVQAQVLQFLLHGKFYKSGSE